MSDGSTQCVARRDVGLLPKWAWVPDYLAARHPADSLTLRTQLSVWQTWQTFLIQTATISPDLVTRELAGQFVRWRCQTVQRVTAINQVIVFHSFLEEAVLRGLCDCNPFRKLRLRIGPVPEKPEVTPELEQEIREAIEHDGTKYRDFLRVSMEIGIYQGQRISATRMLLANMDPERNHIRFWVKGQKWHVTQLHPRVKAALLPLRGRQEWTYEQPSDTDRFSYIWHVFLDRHGFVKRFPRLCFHSFRVTCVSRLARAGVTESKAMKFVGHSSFLIHRVYQRLRVEDLSDCIKALA